jgi:hypothetical protein
MATNTDSHSSISASSSNKNSARFLKDLLADKLIFMQTIDAICSDDDNDMETVVSGSGYTLTVDDLQATVKERQSGSGFDIRICGGKYEFTEPSDMKSHSLLASTANAKIYVDGAPVANNTQEDGSVVWTYGGYKYTVTFDVGFDVTADPKPHSFSGNRVPADGGGSEETVSGKQAIPPATDLATLISNPYIQAVALIATVGGCTMMTVCTCVWKYLKNNHSWRLDSVLRGRSWARDIISNARGEDGYMPDPPLDYQRMQTGVEQKIYRAFNDYITTNGLDPSNLTEDQLEEIRKEASADGTNEFEQKVTAEVQGQCETRFRRYATFTRQDDAVKLIAEETARKSFKDRVKGLDYKADYLRAVVNCARETMIKQQANDSSKNYSDLSDTAKGAAAELREKKEEKKKAKDKREQDLKDEGKTDEEIANDEEVKELETEIEQLEEKAKKKDQESADDSEKADEEKKTADESDGRKQEAEKKKNEKSGEVYGSHGA